MLRFPFTVLLLLSVACVHIHAPQHTVRVLKETDDSILVAYDEPSLANQIELEMTELAEQHCTDSYDFGKPKIVTATRTRQVENMRIPKQECQTYTSYSGPMGSGTSRTQCRTVWPNPSYSTQLYSVVEHHQWIICHDDEA